MEAKDYRITVMKQLEIRPDHFGVLIPELQDAITYAAQNLMGVSHLSDKLAVVEAERDACKQTCKASSEIDNAIIERLKAENAELRKQITNLEHFTSSLIQRQE